MSDFTKEDWMDWKLNPVTKAMYDVIRERVSDAKDLLAGTAGQSVRDDAILVGIIRAYNEILEMNYEGD